MMDTTHLKVDGISLLQSSTKELECSLDMLVEQLEVRDTLLGEERASHTTVESMEGLNRANTKEDVYLAYFHISPDSRRRVSDTDVRK